MSSYLGAVFSGFPKMHLFESLKVHQVCFYQLEWQNESIVIVVTFVADGDACLPVS